jgi:hypothetical protein
MTMHEIQHGTRANVRHVGLELIADMARISGLDLFMPNRKDIRNPRTENLLAAFRYITSGETVLSDNNRD